jgi:hypothetical protein
MTFLVLALTLLAAQNDEPEPVAMVLAVQGQSKLRQMDFLRPGQELHVPAAGQVRLVFLADGHRETLKSGRAVKITEAGGTPAEAVSREKTKLPASQLDGLRAMAESSRAGVSLVRDVGAPPPPISPMEGEFVLVEKPAFKWAPATKGGEYTIRVFRGIVDAEQDLLWSAASASEQLTFPEGRPGLLRGEIYTWKVLARDKAIVAQGTFRVAAKEEADEFEPVRKLSESSEKSDRLMAAMLYEAGQVYGHSQRLFEALLKETPEEPWVMLATARHVARVGRMEEAKRMEKRALEIAEKR